MSHILIAKNKVSYASNHDKE